MIAGDMLQRASDRVNQKQLSSIEDNDSSTAGSPHALRVNQHRSGTPPNLKQTFDLSALFLEAGVPIGAGWDPTKLSFYARISIALTESVEGSRSDTDSQTSPALAELHARTALQGLLMVATGEADGRRTK